ncbi:ADS_G0052170.mRNA.1.CDS.1 [Saccharomyces cerevisiae]|nr:ADS_G0052170.mRNA.1.CDS.1 [Saccharomyces cerevisiae]CAI6894323.1 ADS_G0052170.mRNA.1.CDS.1 [Saccharomyces cerevisiae]
MVLHTIKASHGQCSAPRTTYLINDGVREAFYEYDKHRRNFYATPEGRGTSNKGNRVCPINNNEIGQRMISKHFVLTKNESAASFRFGASA